MQELVTEDLTPRVYATMQKDVGSGSRLSLIVKAHCSSGR